MGITVALAYKEQSGVRVTDSAENISCRQIENVSDIIVTLGDLVTIASSDCYILPENFADSKLAETVKAEAPEQGQYTVLIFLVHTDEERPSQDTTDKIVYEIERALSAFDLGVARCSITAYYAMSVLN